MNWNNLRITDAGTDAETLANYLEDDGIRARSRNEDVMKVMSEQYETAKDILSAQDIDYSESDKLYAD